MVELPKAYAFAEKKFPLPKGLVGIRSPGADGHDQKIGSFATEVKMRVGNHFNSYWDTPLLVLVLSIDEAGAAQTISRSMYLVVTTRGMTSRSPVLPFTANL